LFLAFLLVPLIEIGLFIQVGGWIGLWPTLGIVVLTAVFGTWLVRREGLAALAQVKGRLRTFSDPTEPLAHGALILLAGALLLTPGFFTDSCGLLLLIPGVRAAVVRYLGARLRVQTGFSRDPRPDPTVVDGEFYEVEPDPTSIQPPTDWTRR
jgi:UPF0716 protein FxsA